MKIRNSKKMSATVGEIRGEHWGGKWGTQSKQANQGLHCFPFLCQLRASSSENSS